MVNSDASCIISIRIERVETLNELAPLVSEHKLKGECRKKKELPVR